MDEPDRIAYLKQNEGSKEWLFHSLEGLLNGTAKLADQFGDDQWAYLMGLRHDLEKYLDEF